MKTIKQNNMKTMYQAVRNFVSPFVIISPIDKSQVIVGISEQSQICYQVKIRCALTTDIQEYGWDCCDSQRIVSIKQENGRLWVETSCSDESLVIGNGYTIYAQTSISNNKDFIWQALDLETLETYIVNEVV